MDRPQKILTAIGTFFIITTWVTTLLRIYVRSVMIKNFGLEDYLAGIALILFTASVGIALKGIAVSGGRHFSEMTLEQIKDSMMWWMLLEIFYTVTISVIRASIAVFLLRLTTLRSQIIIIWSTLSIITAYSAFYFFFIIFQCNPPSAFYTEFGGNSQVCIKASIFGAVTYAHSSLGAATDWVLALIPMFLVARLQMNIRTKISVSIVLGLAGVAAIAVIIRIPYVKILVNSTDFLFDCTNVVIWTSIEPGLGLTAASLATLRPLFQAFLSRTRLFGSSVGGRATYDGKSSGRSRSRFSSSKSKGYLRSTRDEDFEMGIAGNGTGIGGFGMLGKEMGVSIGTVTTVIDTTPEGDRESESRLGVLPDVGDGGDGFENRATVGLSRSESQKKSKKRISDWLHNGGDSPDPSDHHHQIHIRKTVEVRTQSGTLLRTF